MTTDKKLLQMASGERRLDPDQQRRYLGTFAERVLLSGTIADAHHPELIKAFSSILGDYKNNHAELQLKLSAQLDKTVELTFLKTAMALDVPATVVDEDKAQSPYGFILHTNKAEQLAETDVRHLYPDLFKETSTKPAKKGFFQTLFGG